MAAFASFPAGPFRRRAFGFGLFARGRARFAFLRFFFARFGSGLASLFERRAQRRDFFRPRPVPGVFFGAFGDEFGGLFD